jgi:hypothetical protein
MLLYNETVGIDKDVEQEWLLWMHETYIPAMMGTGMFVDSKLYKVLHDNDDGGISYSAQYFASSIEKIQQYLDEFAPTFADVLMKKFANKHIVFRTLLEQV